MTKNQDISTITPDNILIHEFLGRKFIPVKAGWGYNYHFINKKFKSYQKCFDFCQQINKGKEPDECYFALPQHSLKFEYSTDWNELMLVVKKIESINDPHHGYFGVHISSNACSIQGTFLHRAIADLEGYGYVYMSDPNAIFATKEKSTYYNIVEFLKWYKNYKAS